MKKKLALLIVLCMVFSMCACGKNAEAAAPAAEEVVAAADEKSAEPAAEDASVTASENAASENAAAPEADAAPAEEAAKPEFVSRIPDYDAMYASHSADEVVMTIDGSDITWKDYFSIYYLYISDIASQLDMMEQYYGMSQGWNDKVSAESDMTYAEYAAEGTASELTQMVLYENVAAAKGAALDEADEEEINKEIDAAAVKACGEGATAGDYFASLEEFYVSEPFYRRMMSSNLYITKTMEKLYGTHGEKVSDEDVVSVLSGSGYMTAKHILFMTVDRDTGETLDEDSTREAKAKAEEISAELKAIEDDAERKAKFDEYEAEFNADPGRATFPEGYTFVEGTMYESFETAVKALGDWEVSDVVESVSGYHIIMRLPLSREALILTSSGIIEAPMLAASTAYAEELKNYYDSMETTFAEGFKAPDPAEFAA